MFGLNFSIVIDHCKKLKGMLFFEVRSDSCIIIWGYCSKQQAN